MECRQKRENKLGLALAHYEKLASDKPSLVQQLKAPTDTPISCPLCCISVQFHMDNIQDAKIFK